MMESPWRDVTIPIEIQKMPVMGYQLLRNCRSQLHQTICQISRQSCQLRRGTKFKKKHDEHLNKDFESISVSVKIFGTCWHHALKLINEKGKMVTETTHEKSNFFSLMIIEYFYPTWELFGCYGHFKTLKRVIRWSFTYDTWRKHFSIAQFHLYSLYLAVGNLKCDHIFLLNVCYTAFLCYGRIFSVSFLRKLCRVWFPCGSSCLRRA